MEFRISWEFRTKLWICGRYFYTFVVEKLDLHMCCHYNRGVMAFKQTARLLQKAISTVKNVEAGKIRAWSHLPYLCMWMGAASYHHWQLYNSNKEMQWRYAVCYLWHLLYNARPSPTQVVMISNSYTIKRWLRATDALQQSFSVSWKVLEQCGSHLYSIGAILI